jgi:3-hydroxybutyryl-CoA dehydrogenase
LAACDILPCWRRLISQRIDPKEITSGVIGLGLMGHSIIACLLAAGHPVVALTRKLALHRGSRRRISTLLRDMQREHLLDADPELLLSRLTLSEDVGALSPCAIVIESVIENLAAKHATYRAVESVVPRGTVIGSNSSAIPVTILQRDAVHPGRFVGIHWAEPAHVTRFMEIIAGERTSKKCTRQVMALAERWGKEPSLVRRDVRGFITNRVSYALFREACSLVDSGVATVEDVDRSLRNDIGWWIPFAGPFRYMDLMGVEGYYKVMKNLLPDLNTSPRVPPLMRKIVKSGGRGISSGRGFYKYTPSQAKRWEKLFMKFNYDLRRLAMQYPVEIGDRAVRKSRRA